MVVARPCGQRDVSRGLRSGRGITLYGYDDDQAYRRHSAALANRTGAPISDAPANHSDLRSNTLALKVGDWFRQLDKNEKRCVKIHTITGFVMTADDQPYSVRIQGTDETWDYEYALLNVVADRDGGSGTCRQKNDLIGIFRGLKK